MSASNKMSEWEEKDLSRIVRILIKDRTLVQSWTEFNDKLGVVNPKFVQWKIEFLNGTLAPYELFLHILSSWKSQKGDAATLNSLCETLRDIHKVVAAELLESEFGATSTSDRTRSLWPLWFNVGRVNKHFVGRLKQLTQLQMWNENPSDQIILISGLGGIGKTELTKKFTYEVHKKGNTSCTWFDAETKQSLNQSLIDLGKTIGIPIDNEGQRVRKTLEVFTDLIAIIRCRISNSKLNYWLVVFDNVNDLYPDLRICLELLSKTENTFTILTSRTQMIAQKATVDWFLISLEEWDSESATEFVKRSLKISNNTEDVAIRTLCDRLQNHPIAMQQAVSYIIHQNHNSPKCAKYCISDYIREFDSDGEKTINLLDHRLNEVTNEYEETTFSTLNTTVAQIKDLTQDIGELACSVFNKLCYFHPSSIRLQFLKEIVKLEESSKAKTNENYEAVLNEALYLLKSYSFIKQDDGLITVHRLVQTVVRLRLNFSNEEIDVLSSILELIPKVSLPLPSCNDIIHVQNVWKYASNYDKLIKKFPTVPNIVSKRLYDLGLYSELKSFANLYLEVMGSILNHDHIETLHLKNALAMALFAEGEAEKSLEIFNEVWEKQKETLGEDDILSTGTANNIVTVLSHLKRLDEATRLSKQVLKILEPLEEESEHTIVSKQNLANVYYREGKFDLAIPVFHEVCKWQERELGKTHSHTLSSQHNIGVCLFKQQKYQAAYDQLKPIVDLRTANLGEEHPNTLRSQFWLGLAHYKLGNGTKCQQILQQVLAKETKVLGTSHPQTMETEEAMNKINEAFFSSVKPAARKDTAYNSKKLEKDVGEDFIISIDGRQTGSNKLTLDPEKKIKYPITHGLSINASNFSGREKELNEINEHFKCFKNLILICGLGGIGKTELCKKFANEICLTDKNVKISRIWLHGETAETLHDSVKKLAEELGVKGHASTLEYFQYLTQMILEKSDRLLVLIDNIDVVYEEVTNVIKTMQNTNNENMCIIVTSRDSLVLGVGRLTILINELSKQDVRTMLRKSLSNLSDSDADKLGELVQNFPLALQQAVGFIIQQRAHFRTQNYSVQNYVEEFEEKKELMLGQKLDKVGHKYQMTTLVVWNMTFDKIKRECKDAGEILKILAHLNPEDIELDFLEEICRRRDLNFDKGFSIINKYCIVKLNANANRKMCSIHRLLQDVLRGENNNFEYATALFDDVFFVIVARKAYKRYGSVIDRLESLHLKSVCKYANLKWVSDSFIHFEDALLIAVKLNRLDCALECIKLVCPQLMESNSTELSEEMKRELVEKFVLWCVINERYDNVTKAIVMNGEYDAHWGYSAFSVNLIEEALKISIKYFGENSKLHFFAINKLVREVCKCHDINKAIELCEGFCNFQFDREKKLIYFDTISYILEEIDNKRGVEIQQVERVEKIVGHFSEIHPKSVEFVGLLEAIIFYFKNDYIKALDLIQQFLPQLEENHEEPIKSWYEKKELELKIKTIDFDVLTREEIEWEVGELDYEKLSLRGLEKIEQLFEVNFGVIDPLTIGIKVAVADELCSIDREKCIKLCEFVLNSPVDTYYESAFSNLCYAKSISRNYDEQKLFLEKLLEQKESLGENNSNLIRVKQLLANMMEKLGDLTGALDLFEHVKKSAMDCGWSENDLKKSRTNVARLKLKIGNFNDIKTREDISREFGGFNYYELSFDQLQKILPIYISVLGDSDELTLELKLGMAWKLYYSKENDKALELVEEIIGSEGNEDLIKRVYNLMYVIGCHLKYKQNYVKAKELLEKVLQYQTQTGLDVTYTNKALAEVEELRNVFKK